MSVEYRYNDIAREMLQIDEDTRLDPKLEEMLDIADTYCSIAGGQLASRQAIAVILMQWEMSK